MAILQAPLKRVSQLMLGNLFGYGLSLLLLPALTRLYSPAEFGLFGLFFGLTQIGGLAATLRLEKAIFVVDSREEAESLACCAYAVGALVSSSLAAIVGLFVLSGIAPLLWLCVPFLVFFQSATLIEIAWGNYGNRYKRSAIARGLQGAAPSIGALVLAPLDTHGLVLGFLAAQAVAVIYLRFSTVAPFFGSARKVSAELTNHLGKHRNFALYTAPHEITGALSSQATSLLIPSLFGPAIAGIYFIAQKAAMLPSILIGGASAQVYFHELGKVRTHPEQRRRVFQITLTLAASLSLIFFTPIYVFAPFFIETIFGNSWMLAGHYTQILAPWAALHLVGSILSQTPQALNSQRTALLIELANAASRIGCLVLGYVLHSAQLGIVFFVASSIVFTGGRLLWYTRLINRE